MDQSYMEYMDNLNSNLSYIENMNTMSSMNVGDVILKFLLAYGIILVALAIFFLVVNWKLLKKAGEPGWKCLIPLYGQYIFYKIAGVSALFWVTLLLIVVNALFNITALKIIIGIVLIVISIVYAKNLAKSFGKGAGFVVGLIFLPVIFTPILAFGTSEYIGEKK